MRFPGQLPRIVPIECVGIVEFCHERFRIERVSRLTDFLFRAEGLESSGRNEGCATLFSWGIESIGFSGTARYRSDLQVADFL